MAPEQVFGAANAIALVTWLLLAALPDRRWVTALSGVRPADWHPDKS
jgi:hypothetical protein